MKDNFIHVCFVIDESGSMWGSEEDVRGGFKKVIEEQKSFPWLKNKIALHLDFYLPNHNIYIECQGRQHFEPVDKFGGEADFLETRERDLKKISLCKENGLKPIYYCLTRKYTEFEGEKVVKNETELLEKIKEISS